MELVQVSDLKIIETPKGGIFHALKKSDASFKAFGEAYFSTVNYKEIKGWKKHLKMTLNLIVVVGEIRFIIFDETKNKFQDFILSRKNSQSYKRLTVPPGYWMAFQGLASSENLLLNIADIEHDPNESLNKELNELKHDW